MVMGIQLWEPSAAWSELPGTLSSHPNGTVNPWSWSGPGGHCGREQRRDPVALAGVLLEGLLEVVTLDTRHLEEQHDETQDEEEEGQSGAWEGVRERETPQGRRDPSRAALTPLGKWGVLRLGDGDSLASQRLRTMTDSHLRPLPKVQILFGPVPAPLARTLCLSSCLRRLAPPTPGQGSGPVPTPPPESTHLTAATP